MEITVVREVLFGGVSRVFWVMVIIYPVTLKFVWGRIKFMIKEALYGYNNPLLNTYSLKYLFIVESNISFIIGFEI